MKSRIDVEVVRSAGGEKAIVSVRRAIEDLNAYPTYSDRWNLHPPIEISRGCPFGCRYCEVSYLFGRRMRHREIDVIRRIAEHYLKLGLTDIRFISPNSFAYGSKDGREPNPEKISKLLKELAEIPLPKRIFFGTFPSEARPDFVTPEILDCISRYCANSRIAIGAQSGSDRVLKSIGRQHDVSCVFEAVDLIKDFGFTPIVDVIFGLPPETPDDQFETLRLIKELTERGAEIRVHYFMPLAGTPYANAKPQPLLTDVRKELRRLTGTGKIKGAWELQERVSQSIVRWREFISQEGEGRGGNFKKIAADF